MTMNFDVRLIAAVGRSGQLGLNGHLPWNDPMDLRWFREQTMDGVVLMGARTYNAVGDLPGRSRARWGGKTSPYGVLQQINVRFRGKVIWIAGGAYTYQMFMPFVRVAIVTRIDYDGPADTYMPPLWGPNAYQPNDRATRDNRASAPPKAPPDNSAEEGTSKPSDRYAFTRLPRRRWKTRRIL